MRASERSRAHRPLIALGATAALAAALVACNALIGLDAFEKAPCVGGDCRDGSLDGGDSGPFDDADTPLPDAGEGADPVAWARWPMPNYDDKSDGGHPNRASYQPAADGFVVDSVTKLVWRAKTSKAPLTYAQAEQECGDGERLPKRIELVSLLDLAQTGTKVDPVAFPGAVGGEYWTSSERRPLTGEPGRWVVDFKNGAVLTRDTNNDTAYVRCVKGAKP